MIHELWPEEEDPNAFLRASLGPVFEQPSSVILSDRYGCIRWIAFVCLYTELPKSEVSSLDLLRAHDLPEYERIQELARLRMAERQTGYVRTPDKLAVQDWARRYSPDLQTSADRIKAAVLTRGVQLTEDAVAVSASHAAWEQRGVTEHDILEAMGLSVAEARSKVWRFKGGRLPDPPARQRRD